VRIDAVSASGGQGEGIGFFHKLNEIDYHFVVANKYVVMGVTEGSPTKRN
jgi:hypothetical protein